MDNPSTILHSGGTDSGVQGLLFALAAVLVATLVAAPLFLLVSLPSLLLIYVLAVVVTGLRMGPLPALFAAFSGLCVRAHLRDTSKPQSVSLMDDGYLTIDTGKRIVTIAGRNAGLTPKEYSVLVALAAVPNCVITQSQLLLNIWGPTHGQDTHYLRIVISHLCQKLGDDPTEPRYIRTESGVGYRLVWDAASTQGE
jgi:hypothetical protein